MHILFQGDSVTDAGRSYTDLTDLGPGYVATTVRLLQEAFPNTAFTFTNRGISGNRTENLVERLQRDFLDLKPDFVTILIGVNDSWHRCPPTCIETTHEMFEKNYRTVLEALREQNIPVLMLEPFSLPNPALQDFREDMIVNIETVRKLAREFACAYIPLDGLATAKSIQDGIASVTDDGVHPNEAGRVWLGTLLAETMIPLLKKLL